ncbi:hypothetical protein L2E82_27787 [Cichorium intybus]|uniref:Uncharacterized protein n=1 Tax=Cichorium intybus TaxID=13427 RepID=A0ACB9CU22_CICIN|nr:hypothetical protein L2E82_27787 [Cichorium intybus]
MFSEAMMIRHSDGKSGFPKKRHLDGEKWDCDVIRCFNDVTQWMYEWIEVFTFSRMITWLGNTINLLTNGKKCRRVRDKECFKLGARVSMKWDLEWGNS